MASNEKQKEKRDGGAHESTSKPHEIFYRLRFLPPFKSTKLEKKLNHMSLWEALQIQIAAAALFELLHLSVVFLLPC